DPCRRETFSAIRGEGARINGEVIPRGRARARALEDAVLATDDDVIHPGKFCREARAVRRLGWAALELAWVALGRIDGFWEVDLALWDSAAGGLIALEAGCSFGEALSKTRHRRVLVWAAASPELFQAMTEVLRRTP